jgi:outer membrane protein
MPMIRPVVRTSLRAAAGLVLSAAPLPAQQAPPPAPADLSLEQAVELARRSSPTLLEQGNDVDVARAAVRAAHGDLLPTVGTSLSFGYTAPGERRSGSVVIAQQPSVLTSSYAVNASYGLSAQRLMQPRAARGDVRAARARVAGAEAALVSDVTQKYLAALQAREELELSEREVRRTSEHAQNARDRLDAGAVTPVDVKQAEVQQGRAELRRLRARNALAAAMQALGSAMGVDVGPGVRLTSAFGVFEPRWSLDDLLARAHAANPSVAAAAEASRTARVRVRAARAQVLPTLNLGVAWNGWAQRTGNEEAQVAQRLGARPWDPAKEAAARSQVRAANAGWPFGYNRQPVSASLSVSLPVFSGFGRAQQVQQARASEQDAGLQLRAEQQRVAQELATALGDLRTAWEASRMAARVVDAAAEGLEMARERFRLGLSNSLAVADAQAQLSQAEQEQTGAVFDFHRALARLEALVGQPLR